ncbi:MAG: HD domain-containing protein [Polyangiales bacterium]
MILRDPVHDLISFESQEDEIVPALLDTIEMQRLRRIRQLGVTHLVFPGAEHSRFTHAIGAAHVMKRLIRRLREIDVELPFWQRLSSDRARDALAAALLHDVGHGPYSHLFEEAMVGAPKHETWSLRIVRDPSTQVHKILARHDSALPERVASLIGVGAGVRPYELQYLAHAVSGTFDVDRCDYLLRDAHMTGVRYGLFDLDWLLRSLRFAPAVSTPPSDPSRQPAESNVAPSFAIDSMKGLPAIEGFVLARRFMFEQVYLHKATRAAEAMMKAIFARASRVLRDGGKLDAVPDALRAASRGETIKLSSYLALDDVRVGAAIAAWETGSDPVLADLCRRLHARHIGKTIDLTSEGANPSRIEQLVAEARELAVEAGLDPDAHVTLDIAQDSHGLVNDDGESLQVILNDGSTHRLVDVSSLLRALSQVPIRRVRLVVAHEIRNELVRRIAEM